MTHASEKNILVVDDEPDVRQFLATCISDAGFNVDTANDGVNALEKVAANPPDLITLDMVMPRRSGIGFMRKLRKNEAWSKIPVIIITAHAHDEFGSEDIKEFTAFAARQRPKITLEKPVTPVKLVKAIKDILEVDIDEDGTGSGLTSSAAPNDDLLKMIQNTDAETLSKIKALLKD